MIYTLRDVQNDDHEFLVNLHNDPVVLRNLTHPQPVTMEQHLHWWEKTQHDKRQVRRVFMANDSRVGFAKFYDIDHENSNCVLGADIHETFRGRGFAKPMWSMMLDLCFDVWKLHRVSLTTAEYNDVAIHVYESMGFAYEGRLTQSLKRDDKFYDQHVMFMLREDWRGWPK